MLTDYFADNLDEYYEVYTDLFTFEELSELGTLVFLCKYNGCIEQEIYAAKLSEETKLWMMLSGNPPRQISNFMRPYYRLTVFPIQRADYDEMIDMIREWG